MAAEKFTTDQLCDQAQQFLKRHDLDAAAALYEQGIQQDPEHIGAHEGLAAICFARKEHDRAVALFKRVVALAPRRAGVLVNLGAAYNRQGDYVNAIKTLRQAITRNHLCAEAYYNLGFAERASSQLGLAVSAFKEAIRHAPEMWEAYVNLGQTLIEMKSLTQAELQFRKALQLNPKSKRARDGLLACQASLDAQKAARNPFGRLVNMEEIARKNSGDQSSLQLPGTALTPEQQLFDRSEAFRRSGELEHCAELLLNQTRSELAPAILKFMRLLNDQPSHAWGQCFGSFEITIQRFQSMLKIVEFKIEELHRHDDSIRSLQHTEARPLRNSQLE